MKPAAHTVTPLLLLALIGAACASGAPEAPRRSAPEADAGEVDKLRDALEEALRGSPPRDSLRLLVECRGDRGMRAVELFGTGVGIWERRRQFRAGPKTIDEALRRLLAAGFASFEPLYGKQEGEEAPREIPDKAQPPLVVCRISVTLAGLAKQSVQVDEGEQFEPLLELADGILDRCSPDAVRGVEASDLDDGLERLARGELAPESWQALLHVVPEPRRGRDPGPGLWLKLEGTRAVARPVDSEGRFGPARELDLARNEIAEIAGAFATERPDELPGNLWAVTYTSLSLRVLDRSRSIQARRFAGMAATTHGERQARFDRMVERLEELYDKVRREGKLSDAP